MGFGVMEPARHLPGGFLHLVFKIRSRHFFSPDFPATFIRS